MGRYLTRWLIPLPAILFAVFPQIANAEPIQGLNAVGYTVSEIPPTKSDDLYPVCHSELENNINRNFNGEPFGNCPVDLFMIHYTGFIEIPANSTIKFMVAADDGGTVKIGTTEFGTWNDKGCSWSAQTTETFTAGSYLLDGWFYEHGGGTCYMLAWNIDDEGWAIVPDDAFTTTAISPTTTSTTTTTTTPTTTLPPTTSTVSSTTILPTSTTTILEVATTQTTTTTEPPATTTTTTTQPPAPAPIISTPALTTTTSTTSETTTTTTSLPATTTTSTEATTSVQDTSTTTSRPETTTTTSEPISDSTESTLPNETETTLPLPQPDDSEGSNAIVEPAISIETDETGQISETVFDQILDDIGQAEPAKVVAIVEAILATNITQSQAVELIVSPAVLEAVSGEQAEQIFETIEPETLTEAQAEQMSEVLSEAPSKIKKAFEKVLDIFGSQFETYIATGSSIPVSQRRSLVAIGGLLTMLPPPPVRNKP